MVTMIRNISTTNQKPVSVAASRYSRRQRSIQSLIVLLLALCWPSSAVAQGTNVPWLPLYFVNATGVLCNGCLLDTWAAGTTTEQTTYSDSTLSTANANPVVMGSDGRPTSGGLYLSATSYRFRLRTAAGVTIWTLDNITAVPTTSGNVDITGTAGEAITAGQVVYLSDGSGALTAGRWYTADADNTYSSTTAYLVGVAPTAISSAASGSIRLVGRVTGLTGLTSGELYYASATAGALTGTPPTNARFIGKADSTTTLVIGGGAGALCLPDSDGTHSLCQRTSSDLTADRLLTFVPGDAARTVTLSGNLTVSGNSTVDNWFDQSVKTTATPTFHYTLPCQGRLTLTSGTSVTTGDVTAAGTIYYTPHIGNQCWVYDGSASFVLRTFSEISLAITCTAANMYDVWVYDNAGTLALETLIWTNPTTRATALVRQNGVYVKTGVTTRRYAGSFYCTNTNQTESSFAKRHLWNYENRVPLPMRVLEDADQWDYNGVLRQANSDTANQLDFVIGVAEVPLFVQVNGWVSPSVNRTVGASIGLDSTSARATGTIGASVTCAATLRCNPTATLLTYPAIGRHFAASLETSDGATTTWYGDSAGSDFISGITGWTEG